MGGSEWSSFLKRLLKYFRISPYTRSNYCIAAGILSASNGAFDVKYIDALFLCVSGITGTGLVTVDLSALTPLQQVILVIVSLIWK
ncbi:hypothetical protein F5888DRAFT_1674909 [Russula emetica]|nr:hypothetical protein F5888DRAFT_1752188 [Russula emetica]KAF8501739.1 hypothetical protein F5888DRAFT_1674909 [Russula emetica]